MKKSIKKIYRKLFPSDQNVPTGKMSNAENTKLLIEKYLNAGRIPWTPGYNEYKWEWILDTINNKSLLDSINTKEALPIDFGLGLDDRCVEYPWIFSKLSNQKKKILDAGSTFNFQQIVNFEMLKQKDLTILTYFPEKNNFNEKRISYVYSDLRDMPFRNELFDEVVCQSTIEHIEMDNSIYGYDLEKVTEEKKSYEYLKAINELLRVLKKNGLLLLTFPYGNYENHGFFQQFDKEMLGRIEELLKQNGNYSISYFMYKKNGWAFVAQQECDQSESYNPHTGRGKGDDGAAHCRGICCIDFVKSK